MNWLLNLLQLTQTTLLPLARKLAGYLYGLTPEEWSALLDLVVEAESIKTMPGPQRALWVLERLQKFPNVILPDSTLRKAIDFAVMVLWRSGRVHLRGMFNSTAHS